MNGRLVSYSQLIFAPGKRTPGHSLQQSNTHDHIGNFIYLSGKSQIKGNTAYLACGGIGSTSSNKISL